MLKVIGVRFKNAGKILYFDPLELSIHRGDDVIVDTVRGIEYGTVVVGAKFVKEDEVVLPVRQIIRVASPADKEQMERNSIESKEALQLCQEKVIRHQLMMKLVDAEYTFDRNKLIFYFTAEGRIDFRELVRDLASVFRTRIELRQIGVRDEAKMLGGIGPCGRILCCSSFLGDFEPVSIKMAKDQNLSLNPAKISGLCGRLMCCLKYENEYYEELKELFPDIGDLVSTPSGPGRVISLNLLDQRVQVELSETGMLMEYKLEEVHVKNEPQHVG